MTFIFSVIAIIFCVGISFLATSGVLWLALWALSLVGVNLTFSWGLAVAVWLILLVIKCIT